MNSGAGLFLYGAPGNGKSTLARRITSCFGQHIWVPQAVVEDGQLIKVYDAAYHDADNLDRPAEFGRVEVYGKRRFVGKRRQPV